MTTDRTRSDRTGPGHRWPGSVFGSGAEPDPRFSFANQRTLLAWLRTALALVLAAAVVDAVPLDVSSIWRLVATVVLSALGIAAAVHGWWAWMRSERALRHRRPLPSSAAVGVVTVVGLVAIAVLVVAVGVSGA